MACLVCKSSSKEEPLGKSGIMYECADCGSYGVSGSAIQQMNIHIRVLNESRALDWLSDQREAGFRKPVIEADTPVWD